MASAVIELGNLITALTGLTASFEPLYWMAFYIVSMGIQIRGGSVFWRFNALMAIIPTLLIILYCFVSLPNVNFTQYAVIDIDYTNNYIAIDNSTLSSFDSNKDINGFTNNWHDALKVMPLAAWFFVGVEAMTLSCDDIARPSHTVPPTMVAVMITLLITSISITLTTASQHPGTIGLVDAVLPLSPGYNLAFGNNLTSPILALFALPGVFGTAFGFMFAYGRQVAAMARSGLLPQPLALSGGRNDAPVPALLAGSVIGGSVLLLLWELFPNDQKTISARLFGLCMLGSCCVYVSIFLSFLTARRYLANVPRLFTSPLGIIGAIYGVIVFASMALALAFFQRDNYSALIVFIAILLMALGYYYLIARKKEFLSLQEQEQFMKAYLMRAEAEGNDNFRSNKSGSNARSVSSTNNLSSVVPASVNNHDQNSNHLRKVRSQQLLEKQQQIRAANLVISRSFASKTAFLKRVAPMPAVDNNGNTIPLTPEEQAERLRWEQLADQLFTGHQAPHHQSTGVDKPVEVVVLPSAHKRHTAAFRLQTTGNVNDTAAAGSGGGSDQHRRVKLVETDTAVEIIPGLL